MPKSLNVEARLCKRLSEQLGARLSECSLMVDELIDQSQAAPHAGELRLLLEKIAELQALVGQLGIFSGQQLMVPRLISQSALEALITSLGGGWLEVDLAALPEDDSFAADPEQLRVALDHLLRNARESGAERIRLQASVVEAPALGRGRFLRLAVVDDGPGMSAAVRRWACSPLFSSKREHPGMGLAVAAGVARQHGGELRLECRDQGLTVALLFSLRSSAPKRREQRMAKAEGAELILVVDDDALALAATKRVLSDAGYSVGAYQSAASLLEAPDAHIARAALLITDVVMPGISGLELAERLSARLPSIGLLYTSGYDRQDLAASLGEQAHFIGKPFACDELLGAVNEVISEHKKAR